MSSATLELVERPDEIGVVVHADTLTDLFRTAAQGMFQLMVGREAFDRVRYHGTITETRSIPLHGEELSILLGEWLGQLLGWYTTASLCPVNIEFRALSTRRLDARIDCAVCTAKVRTFDGIAEHRLDLNQLEHDWHAKVVFQLS